MGQTQYDEEDAPVSDERQAVRAEQLEMREAKRRAKALWLDLRRASHLVRFTDPAALRSIGFAVERSWREVRWCDIESAITAHAAMPFSKSPWLLDAWARQAKLERETREFAAMPVDDQLAAIRAAR